MWKPKGAGRVFSPALEPWGKLPAPEFHRSYGVRHARIKPKMHAVKKKATLSLLRHKNPNERAAESGVKQNQKILS